MSIKIDYIDMFLVCVDCLDLSRRMFNRWRLLVGGRILGTNRGANRIENGKRLYFIPELAHSTKLTSGYVRY